MTDPVVPDLTADELEAARLSGMPPERYAAIKAAPRQPSGARTVADVQAAIRHTTTNPKE